MKDENDINIELKAKHEEMLLNKKKYDIDNMVESLLLFFSNYSNNLSIEIVDKICIINKIDKNNQESEIVKSMVVALFDMINQKLKENTVSKFNIFKEKMVSINNNDYNKVLNQLSHMIINEISDFYLENGIVLVNELGKDDNRIELNNYIMKIIYGKLINKLKDQFMYSVRLIDNNYEENEQIINSINQKIINKV